MNAYFEQTVLNADPIDLIRLLYQRAISCVRDARQHLQHGRIAERSAAIMRAYSVIAELLSALRQETAPDLVRRLQSLYFYIQQRLLDANAQQADQPLAEVLGLLTTLEEGWCGVAAKLAPKKEVGDTTDEAPGDTGHHRRYASGRASEDSARIGVHA